MKIRRKGLVGDYFGVSFRVWFWPVFWRLRPPPHSLTAEDAAMAEEAEALEAAMVEASVAAVAISAVAVAISAGLVGVVLVAIALRNIEEGISSMGITSSTEIISGTEIVSGTIAISFLEVPFCMITPTTGMITPTTGMILRTGTTDIRTIDRTTAFAVSWFPIWSTSSPIGGQIDDPTLKALQIS